jgi:hypothetical protein
MVAITTVRKIHKEPDEPFIPEVDMFPWRAWCSLCPWKITAGAWRDGFDMAFYHAKGQIHESPGSRPVVTATPTALLHPTDASGGAKAHRENPAYGTGPGGGSGPSPSVSAGGPVRENTLTGSEIELLDQREEDLKQWAQDHPEFRGRWL